MLYPAVFALALLAAPAGSADQGATAWSFSRADRASALDQLSAAVHQHRRDGAAEEMLIQLRANRPYFLNIGDRAHFARAIDQDMHQVDFRDLLVVRLNNDDGAGVPIGSGLYAVIR